MLYIKDMTFGNPALLLCEILWQVPYVLTTLSTSVYLFIYLSRQKSEGASHTINVQHGTASSKKNGRGAGEGGAGASPFGKPHQARRDGSPTSKCCCCSGAHTAILGSQGI